jgi:hypothetical protein
MRDRNDWLPSGRGTTSSNHQTDQVPQQDAARTKGPWGGQQPTIVQTALPIGRREANTRNAAVTGQAPSPNSHLARLAEAIQKSRRFQSAPRCRQYLRLVQEERQ